MKNTKLGLFPTVLLSLFITTHLVWAQGAWDKGQADSWKKYRVVVVPSDTTIPVGGEVQYKAFLVDSTGARKNANFFWSFAGRPIGLLTQQGHFKALTEGKGLIMATAGRISGKAQVTVQGEGVSLRGTRVVVTPKDTVLEAGEKVMFQAVLVDSTGKPLEAAFVWRVTDARVGKIDAKGNFTALSFGQTSVLAIAGIKIGKANVVVLRDSLPWWRKHRRYDVVVTPKDTCVKIGATVQYKAVLFDSSGKPVDTRFTWSLEEENYGSIDDHGLFTSSAKGEGFVFATSGEFTGKAHVTVLTDLGGWKPKRPFKKLMILPRDTLVAPGKTIQYQAFFVDTAGVKTSAAVKWDLLGRAIGSITSTGEFKALFPGVGMVRARTEDKYTTLARVMVARSQVMIRPDSAQVRFKDMNRKLIGAIHRLAEKDVLKISGLPFPLNVLNGGELVLPPGSLKSDVWIDVTLPDLARLKADSTVDFLKNVLAGVSFHVFVAGKEISPFTFETPVQIVLPYKADLMARLGLTPETLWAFFYTITGGFDSTGVSDVVVDTTENKIILCVSHFSDIVVANRNSAAMTNVGASDALPGTCRLYENYPNPFNPETRIRFDVANGSQSRIRLAVYDILGREVRVLADRAFTPGSHDILWDGKDDLGISQGSGIYILRMESAEVTLTRRMVFMK